MAPQSHMIKGFPVRGGESLESLALAIIKSLSGRETGVFFHISLAKAGFMALPNY